MSKRKNLIEFDKNFLNPLPSLKRFNRTIHSPKIIPKSQSPHSLLDSRTGKKEKNDQPSGFFIKKLEDIGKRLAKDAGSVSPLLNKLETVSILEKSLELNEEDDEKTDLVQNRKVSLSNNSSPVAKIRETELKRDQKNKFRDLEVASLQRENEECVGYIDSLLSEINLLKVRVKNAEENSERVFHNWQVSENSVKVMQNIIQNSDSKIKELQNNLRFKEAEIEEFKEFLKKSEDKRKAANEQMNNIESTLVVFQRQTSKLSSTVQELNKEIIQYKKQVSLNEETISQLNSQISDIQKEAELEKVRSMNEMIEYENSKHLLSERIEQLETRLEKSESEHKKMQDLALKYQIDLKKSASTCQGIKRADTSVGTRVLSNFSKEEASRWHDRCLKLEQELSSLKESLEKYEKNDSYFKSQLFQKNLMIQNLEGTIQTLESSTQSQSLSMRSPVLESSLEIIVHRLKSFEEHFRCEVCAKITTRPLVASPCFHMFCKPCSDYNEKMCSICAVKNVTMASFPLIEVFIEMFQNLKEDLKRLIELA